MESALVVFLPFIFAILLHEVSHGWIAEKLGDPTARQRGRITLNPLKHIDPVMSIMLPALLYFSGSPILFGGAKPVPIDPRYFANPRRDMAFVALAGPVTNFLLALVSFALFAALAALFPNSGGLTGAMLAVLAGSVVVNVMLGIFNLIPVPPLDGGRIAVGFLPRRLAFGLAKLERFGLIIVFGLAASGAVGAVIGPLLHWLLQLLEVAGNIKFE